MADLTEDQRAYLHSELGTDADDTTWQGRYDRLGFVSGVAREVVQERLATMLSKSASLTLTGVMSRDNSANIKALQDQVARLTTAYRADLSLTGEDLAGAGASSIVVGRRDRPR